MKIFVRAAAVVVLALILIFAAAGFLAAFYTIAKRVEVSGEWRR